MKIQRFDAFSAPDYPSRRQFSDCRALLGATVIGLSGVVLAADPPVQAAGNLAEPRPKVPGKPEFQPPVAVKAYIVQKGDTLYGIAQAQLGDGKRWPEIVRVNPGLTDKDLKLGQVIKIPTVVAPVEPPRLGGALPRPK